MKKYSSNYKKLLFIIVKIIFVTIFSLSSFSIFWATDSDYKSDISDEYYSKYLYYTYSDVLNFNHLPDNAKVYKIKAEWNVDSNYISDIRWSILNNSSWYESSVYSMIKTGNDWFDWYSQTSADEKTFHVNNVNAKGNWFFRIYDYYNDSDPEYNKWRIDWIKLTLYYTYEEPKPDLIIKNNSIYLSKANVEPWDRIEVEWVNENIWEAYAGSSYQSVMFSGNDYISSDDTFLDDAEIFWIWAWGKNSEYEDVSIPDYVTRWKIYYIWVIADYKNSVDESNENNNNSASAVAIRINDYNAFSSPALYGPNNWETAVSINEQDFDWGSSSSSNAWTPSYRIVVSENRNFSWFSEAGGSSRCNSTCETTVINSSSYNWFNLKENTTYYWKVRAWNSNAGGHWSNTRSFNTNKPKPDLIIQDGSIYLSKANVEPWDKIKVSWKSENIWNWDSGKTYQSVVLSDDRTINNVEIELWEEYLPPMESQEVDSESLNVTIPLDLVRGKTYYIWVIADSRNSVDEDNEYNNTIASPVAITINSYFSFSAPNLHSPNNWETTISINEQDFDWGSSSSSNAWTPNYRIVVSENGNFSWFSEAGGSSICNSTCETVVIKNSSSHNWFNLKENTTYYWKVRAWNLNAGWYWSDIRNFTTKLPIANFDFVVSNVISGTKRQEAWNKVHFSADIENLGTDKGSYITLKARIRNKQTWEYYDLWDINPGNIELAGHFSGKFDFSVIIPKSGIPNSGQYQIELEIDPDHHYEEAITSNNSSISDQDFVVFYYEPKTELTTGWNNTDINLSDTDSDNKTNSEEKFIWDDPVSENDEPLDRENSTTTSDETSPWWVHRWDPVNMRTWAFEFIQSDFSLKWKWIETLLKRVYNSKTPKKNHRFGNGWSFSHHMYYYEDPDDSNKIIVHRWWITISTFTKNGSTYTPNPWEMDSFKETQDGKILETQDKTKYIFSKELTNNLGILEKIIDRNGNETKLTYKEVKNIPLLEKITDSSWRDIKLIYHDEVDEKWDKVKEMNYTDDDIIYSVQYTYDENINLVKVIKTNNKNTETIEERFSYDSENRLETHTDPRWTILYNTYDNDGKVTKQHEYNPDKDDAWTKRLIYEMSYNLSIGNYNNCSKIKNYSSEITTETICFSEDDLKIYSENELWYSMKIERDEKWLIKSITDEIWSTTRYEYDDKRRKTKEILPDTDKWNTQINYTYEDNYNKLTKKEIIANWINWNISPSINRTTNYKIDSNNWNILEISDPRWNTETFEYDNYGNITKKTDISWNSTIYSYDSKWNYLISVEKYVTSVKWVRQTIKESYEYDEVWNRTKYTDARWNIYKYTYDNHKNLITEEDPYWRKKEHTYDIENHRISTIDEKLVETRYKYDKNINANLIETKIIWLSREITIKNEYDDIWVLVKETTDEIWNVTTYKYDGSGRVIKKTFSDDSYENYRYDKKWRLVRITNELWQKTEYVYDSRDSLLETKKYTDSSNYISEKNEYDGLNRIVKTIDWNANVKTMEYDKNNNLLSVTDIPLLNNSSSGENPNLAPFSQNNIEQTKISYIYDENNNKIWEVLPKAQTDTSLRNTHWHSKSYFYDELNRLIKEVNALGKETLYFYNKNDQIAKLVDRQNPNDTNSEHTSLYEYDKLWNLIKETDSLWNYTSYDYDEVWNIRSKTDKNWGVWEYVYDDFNNLKEEKDPLWNSTLYTYDSAWNRLSTKIPSGGETKYKYDLKSQLIELIDPEGNKIKTKYDSSWNKIEITNKRQFITKYSYDKLNRLIKTTNPQSAVIEYSYDKNSNLVSQSVVSWGVRKTTSFVYDNFNRPVQISNPDSSIESFIYDKNANLLREIDSEGNTTNYSYDALNRLITKVSSFDGIEENYGYDNWGNVVSYEDESGVTSYSYDSNNQNISESKVLSSLQAKTYTTSKTYTKQGQLATRTDARGNKLRNVYDSRWWLKELLNKHPSWSVERSLVNYTYNKDWLRESDKYWNWVETGYNYDSLNRVSRIMTRKWDTSLFGQSYEYDPEWNRLKLVDIASDGSTTQYSYDELDQLKEVNYKKQDENGVFKTETLKFSYDKFWNRVKLESPFWVTEYSYWVNNELKNYVVNDRLRVDMAYDKNGSLLKETYNRSGEDLQVVNYSWNGNNQLKQIIYDSSRSSHLPSLPDNRMSFVYDSIGRSEKSVNGESSYYLNNGLNVWSEIDNSWVIQKTIISWVAEISSSWELTYIHTDILGSTVLLTDSSSEVLSEYDYSPFGSIVWERVLDLQKSTNYLFTGQEYDIESELYYYNARYYNSGLARFISRDKLRFGDVLTANRYIYVRNNPFKYVDPTGWEENIVVLFSGFWNNHTDMEALRERILQETNINNVSIFNHYQQGYSQNKINSIMFKINASKKIGETFRKIGETFRWVDKFKPNLLKIHKTFRKIGETFRWVDKFKPNLLKIHKEYHNLLERRKEHYEQAWALGFIRSNSNSGIIIVGHSFWWDSAIELAKLLQEENRQVNLLIQLDSVGVWDERLPDNVITGRNYYQEWGSWMDGTSYVEGSINTIVPNVNHKDIDKHPAVVNSIIENINEFQTTR